MYRRPYRCEIDYSIINMNKIKVHQICLSVVNQRIAECKENMASIDESSQNEAKSTAGDKFETGIEMLQQEFERIDTQLKHLISLKEELMAINPVPERNRVSPGALVKTNLGTYYISAAVGKVIVDNMSVYALSPQSPMVLSLLGKVVGDQAVVNGRQVIIEGIN